MIVMSEFYHQLFCPGFSSIIVPTQVVLQILIYSFHCGNVEVIFNGVVPNLFTMGFCFSLNNTPVTIIHHCPPAMPFESIHFRNYAKFQVSAVVLKTVFQSIKVGVVLVVFQRLMGHFKMPLSKIHQKYLTQFLQSFQGKYLLLSDYGLSGVQLKLTKDDGCSKSLKYLDVLVIDSRFEGQQKPQFLREGTDILFHSFSYTRHIIFFKSLVIKAVLFFFK